MSNHVTVRMLGGCSIEYAGRSITDQTNRMRKVWLLLACLIYSRGSHLTQEHYIHLLHSSGSEESSDPNGKLKAMLYRVRTLLNQLDKTAGHDWILYKNGTYTWNPEVSVTLDVEQFERLCTAASAAEGSARLDCYLQALELYRGDFLPKLSTEAWVLPISTYYHQMYLSAVEQTFRLLEEQSDWTRIVSLCETALQVEPYSEELYHSLMRGHIALGARSAAAQAYEEMSELLFSTFGVMPSEESRALYREACRETETATVPSGAVRELLKEPEAAKGALYCEYDFFKLLYQLQARSILRTGDVIHIALFSLHGFGKKTLPRRSLDLAMNNLQNIIISNLRRGDVVTRCSVSQLIVMLPQANYENSCNVCQRILKAFSRQYPHSPADIHYTVHPLEPVEHF